MKKALLLQSGEIRIEEAPIPKPLAGEVLIKVHRVGICGSDVHVYRERPSFTEYPLVQGHEMSGEVVDPNGASGLKAGDKIVAGTTLACGDCVWCRKGLIHRCRNLRILGGSTDGCAAEYICLPEYLVFKIPEEIPYDLAAMNEPLSVGVHACNMAGDLSGKNVLVVGAGVIGNVTAQAAKAKGAGKVMICGRTQYRLDHAKACGLDLCVNEAKEDLAAAVLREFGDLADVVFEATGAAESVNTALQNVMEGGTVVIEGLFFGLQAVDMHAVQDKEIHVVGSKICGRADTEEAIALLAAGKVHLAPLITAHFPLEGYKDAYDRLADKSARMMKVMLDL